MLYFENARDALFSHDDSEEVVLYQETFGDLRKISLGVKGSMEYLDRIRAETGSRARRHPHGHRLACALVQADRKGIGKDVRRPAVLA